MSATDCTGTIGTNGRCLACGDVVFDFVWERAQRAMSKPAVRDGLLPVGIRRGRKA